MSGQQSAQARNKAMRTTSIVGAIVNLILTIAKVVFGIIGQSHALIADGVHSLADLSTDLMVWFAAKYSNQPADKEHPYGHARIETAFTVGLGVVLIITAIGIVVDSAQRLLNPETLLQPTPIVLLIAAISIFANEGLYQYTIRVARQCNSGLLKANAWHHRSDALSSIVVLVGVAGSLLGFPYLDAFAALGVALMIGKIGLDQAWTSIRELVDTDISNALVHIDAEDDSIAILCTGLPLRREVLADLRKVWAEDIADDELGRATLHYLNGQVHVDLVRSMQAADADAEQFNQRLQEQAKVLDYIGDVQVLYSYP